MVYPAFQKYWIPQCFLFPSFYDFSGKFSAHGTFLLEKPSSGTLKIERFESGII
jgi:hypothetical protein